MKRQIIPYNPKLKAFAKQLRNNSTNSEVLLWKHISGKKMMGYDFHRQKPIDNYILDFFCYELMLGIELDGITHHVEEVYKRDTQKEARLKELGISLLRFNDYEVLNDIDNVVRGIEGYAEQYNMLLKHTPNPSLEGK
ncbi:MAG: methylase [Flavipsychrobacter sp.]|nr:methylase [Flavipsychrobacter sp.]